MFFMRQDIWLGAIVQVSCPVSACGIKCSWHSTILDENDAKDIDVKQINLIKVKLAK